MLRLGIHLVTSEGVSCFWNALRQSSIHVVALVVVAAPSHAGTPPESPKARATRLAQYDQWTREAANRSRIDWLLVKAVRIKESFNDPNYISTTGAVGLMQLMPCGGGRMFVTTNYRNFLRARRNGRGRISGKTHRVWAQAYQRDLQRLIARTRPPELFRLDTSPTFGYFRAEDYFLGAAALSACSRWRTSSK